MMNNPRGAGRGAGLLSGKNKVANLNWSTTAGLQSGKRQAATPDEQADAGLRTGKSLIDTSYKKVNAELGLGAPGTRNFLGRYSRGYLPHFDANHLVQSLTFRVPDSLPQQKLRQLKLKDLKDQPKTFQERERRKRIERWLDSGMGCCALKHPKVAEVVEEALLQFDDDRYHMIAWCIMPNHVHALIQQLWPLWKILKSWKSYTGRWAIAHNEGLERGIPIHENHAGRDLGIPRRGGENHFWWQETWDRYIRNEEHIWNTIRYIHEIPCEPDSAVVRKIGHGPARDF